MKTFKGKVSISRYSGGKKGHGISIELQDDSSHVKVFRLEMTPEAFGNAVTGFGYQDCTFDMWDTKLVGMQVETKTEYVEYDSYTRDIPKMQAAVAVFEVDGWKATLEDLCNHHRKSNKGYLVGFRRYVKIKEKQA